MFPKLIKYIKILIQEALKNPNHEKYKEIYTSVYHNKTAKNQSKKKHIARSQKIRNRLLSKEQQRDLQQTSQQKR